MKNLRHLIAIAFILIIPAIGFSHSDKAIITTEEVIQSQKDWGNGIVAIGTAYEQKRDYQKITQNLINNLYAYQYGPVLFGPTQAADHQFRLTKEGALSYFIGGNKNFPKDKGFALKPWTNVRFENAGIFLHGNYAVAMGNYYFTPKNGDPVKVEFSFGYIKDSDGKLRINLHHSSFPFDPQKD